MSEPTNAGKALGAAIKEASISVPIVGDDYDGTRGWSQEDFAKYQEAVFDAMGEAIVSFIRDNLQVYGLVSRNDPLAITVLYPHQCHARGTT